MAQKLGPDYLRLVDRLYASVSRGVVETMIETGEDPGDTPAYLNLLQQVNEALTGRLAAQQELYKSRPAPDASAAATGREG